MKSIYLIYSQFDEVSLSDVPRSSTSSCLSAYCTVVYSALLLSSSPPLHPKQPTTLTEQVATHKLKVFPATTKP